jgi:glutamine amidotransferase
MIGIIDYGMGNVRSVKNALGYIGQEATVTSDPDELRSCDRFILPGVGAFGDARDQLRARGLDASLEEQIRGEGKPLLGVCLGMQLLATESEEHGRHQGLGWFAAKVERFPNASGLPVPHLGWNSVDVQNDHPVFAGLRGERSTFYFVHSFRVVSADPAEVVAATCEYGAPFIAALARDNVIGVQFHPEKSQDNGLQLLTNFVNWAA